MTRATDLFRSRANPLLLFNSAARRLPLSTLGFLQYLGPTCQFILAIAVYGEPFAAEQLIAFGWIWLGLAVFSLDRVRRSGPRVARGGAGQPNRPVM